MIPEIREKYNHSFSGEKYVAFLQDLNSTYPGSIEFRLAETPVFIPASFTKKLMEAGEAVIDVISQPDFKNLTQKAIPPYLSVPNETAYCEFISIDFAVCKDEEGELTPQLIELQGFPTMFAFQSYLADAYQKNFDVPLNFTNYLNGYTKKSYLKLLRQIILSQYQPENVILLEVKPHEQKTRIDFYLTQDITGIRPVCITELIKEGKKLFYFRDGIKTKINRIYNRVIFDDLEQQGKSLENFVDLTEELEVEWVTHPNWFYRISKYTLPFIKNKYIPKTYFLHKLPIIPKDLENYVLKPLFSFAGQGVILDVTREDIDNIADPQHWILQRKVEYAPVILTPDVPAKCEIRLMYFQQNADERPVLVHNLTRLSKGKMIGVRYNADREWVGASAAFFEQ
jgi:hypothetical protein